jgi:hypothetical protein
LDVGLIACAEAAPHLHDLALHITAAFEELKALPAVVKNAVKDVVKDAAKTDLKNVAEVTSARVTTAKTKGSKS